MTTASAACELCQQTGGLLVAEGEVWRVVRVADPAFPAFYRVIWRRHVAEFSALLAGERQRCMELVVVLEQVLLARLTPRPTKINLAALGNVVPHLHWHVIARFEGDSHFPNPIWGEPLRQPDAGHLAALVAQLPALDRDVAQACAMLRS